MFPKKVTAVVLGLLLAASFAVAQEGAPAGDETNQERLLRRVKMFWKWRMVEQVDLTEAEADRLFDVVYKYEESIREARRTQREAMRKINDALRDGRTLPKSEVLSLIDESLRAAETIHGLRRKQMKDAAQVLTDEQFHRFVVAQFQFQRELRQRIEGARGRWGRGARGGRFRDSPPPEDMP